VLRLAILLRGHLFVHKVAKESKQNCSVTGIVIVVPWFVFERFSAIPLKLRQARAFGQGWIKYKYFVCARLGIGDNC
jgi:hypothetical protein